MRIKFILLFIIILSQESYSQEIELRNLEKEIWGEINLNGNHIVKGNPSKVIYKNYTYDSQQKTYNETLSTFLNSYRTSTYTFDSIGRVKNRLLFKYGNIKGVDEYYYQQKNKNQNELFIKRYWWYKKNDNSTKKELDFTLKEIYNGHILIHRFSFKFEFEFVYNNKNNLIKIILKEYENPHEYNAQGDILNLKTNKIIKSEILYSYKYDENNNRIEKKEINTEYITYITRYIYNKEGRLVKEIQLSYSEEILNYVNPKIYKYNSQGNIIELNEYIKQTAYESLSGSEEEFIQSFLSYIEEKPNFYLVEQNSYTYEYDEKGNWTSKTFYKKKSNSSFDDKNKLIRQIEYK